MIKKLVLREHHTARWLVFDAPVDFLKADTIQQVTSTLSDVERRVQNENLYAAGYLTYEAAPGFDAALTTLPRGELPLLCMGLFPAPKILNGLPQPAAEYSLPRSWRITTARGDYLEKIDAIKKQIELGNTYQINFTVRQIAEKLVDPWNFFLGIADDAPYAAYLETDQHVIVSLSPELFFRLQGDELTCQPMKGTAARGMTLADDREVATTLYSSSKNRAENVMVTDMLRNDMGRVAVPGTVVVRSLFDIEKFPTLWQMTSTVTASTQASITQLFGALFPCASITGAPKASSMKIIAELEDTPREVYTGTIGYFSPDRHAQFNVAIRTALINKRTQQAVYGVGGGIVWDSEPADEYRECQAKAKVLDRDSPTGDFKLLETLRWSAHEGFFLLDLHLQRLRNSADYFDFCIDRPGIERELSQLASTLTGDGYRIRLLMARTGEIAITETPLDLSAKPKPKRVRLAAQAISANSVFLYHKTTRREIYDQALRTVSDCDDVLLWNDEGYVTETTIANIIVEIDGDFVTPPISCGLLDGTYRKWLLQHGEITERAVHVDELPGVRNLTLINSVRGRYAARLLLD